MRLNESQYWKDEIAENRAILKEIRKSRKEEDEKERVNAIIEAVKSVFGFSYYDLMISKKQSTAHTNAKRILYKHLFDLGFSNLDISNMVSRTPDQVCKLLMTHYEMKGYSNRYDRELKAVELRLEGKEAYDFNYWFIIARSFGTTTQLIKKSSRKIKIAHARYFAAYWLTEVMEFTNKEVAIMLDTFYSNISVYKSKCDNLFRYNPEFKKKAQKALSKLNKHSELINV